MSKHGETRARAFAAACELAAQGKRPSVVAIREALGGVGGQMAVQQGLQDWLDEAARRFRLPSVPEAIQAPVVAFWEAASGLADARWTEAHQALDERIAALEQSLADAVATGADAQAQVGRMAADLHVRSAALAEAQDALDRALAECDTQARALAEGAQALAQARAERDEQVRQRTHTDRVLAEARASLASAQERIARLQAALEVATARNTLLESAAEAAKGAAAQSRADLELAQVVAADLRKTVAVGDRQIAVLTAAVQAEQQARDGDALHWTGQIEDLRGQLRAAVERESRLVAETKELGAETRRLRQDLRRASETPLAEPAAGR